MALTSQLVIGLIQEEDFMRRIAANAGDVVGDILGELSSTLGRDERHAKAIELLAQDPLDVDTRYWRSFGNFVLMVNKESIADEDAARAADDSTMQNWIIPIFNDWAGVKTI